MDSSFEPRFELSYHLADTPTERFTLSLGADGSLSGERARDADALQLSIKRSVAKGSWRLCARVQRDVCIDDLRAIFSVNYTPFEKIYLNGYQSWTDSVERRPFDTMPGLAHVPRKLIESYTLDGSGDYRFSNYSLKPGEMHGWAYAYLKNRDAYTLFASLNEDSGFTRIESSVKARELRLIKEVPARVLTFGEELELISFVVLEGELDACLESWLAIAGIEARPASALVGYSSWYRHYGEIDELKISRDLKGCIEQYTNFELGNVARVFQIDDGWCKVGDWTRPNKMSFSKGMAALAAEIADAGFIPGLWLAPFMAARDSKTYQEHPEWVLRDSAGVRVESNMNWGGAAALDTQNEAFRSYVREFLGLVTKEWGFKLLKLDFLFAACMEVHAELNRGELMADALELIRSSVGEDVMLDLCGVPLASAFGRCEYCRIGCDVGLDWDDKPYMRLLHRERISTKKSLANTKGRAHLDGRVFRCDPDVFFLRDDVKLTALQKYDLIESDLACGGVFFTSDDMGFWDEEARAIFSSALTRFCEKENARNE